MAEWFYRFDGKDLGPISEEDLRHAFDSGALPGSTFVWREGMGDWVPANQSPDFIPKPNDASSLNKRQSPITKNNVIVGCIVIIVFVGSLFALKGNKSPDAIVRLKSDSKTSPVELISESKPHPVQNDGAEGRYEAFRKENDKKHIRNLEQAADKLKLELKRRGPIFSSDEVLKDEKSYSFAGEWDDLKFENEQRYPVFLEGAVAEFGNFMPLKRYRAYSKRSEVILWTSGTNVLCVKMCNYNIAGDVDMEALRFYMAAVKALIRCVDQAGLSKMEEWLNNTIQNTRNETSYRDVKKGFTCTVMFSYKSESHSEILTFLAYDPVLYDFLSNK